jgi:hypothetical protein
MTRSKLENIIKQRAQYIISKEGLIKTGALRESININFDVDDGEFTISAIYYYEYLDGGTKYIKSYDLTEKITNDKIVLDAIEDFFYNYFKEKIDKL